jgi:hypothetical protein
MIDKTNLTKNIEYLREQLYILISYKELTDTKVVECSQKLDNLLTEYEKFNGTIKKSNN